MPDRIIKESSCTSDTLNALSDFEERFWWRLTVNCDDYGRFDARPAVLKSRLFPLADGKTHKDMSKALAALASVGLVEVYEVDGKPFLQVVKWDKHQRIRAKRSKYPSPDEVCCQLTADVGKCPRNPIQSESNPNPNANANAPAQGSAFTVFWEAYPKKVKREEALGAWKALNPDAVMVEKIMTHLEAWKRSKRWLDKNGEFVKQFIPSAANFLEPEGEYMAFKPEPASQAVPKGASGELGEAELEAIQRVLRETENTDAY